MIELIVYLNGIKRALQLKKGFQQASNRWAQGPGLRGPNSVRDGRALIDPVQLITIKITVDSGTNGLNQPTKSVLQNEFYSHFSFHWHFSFWSIQVGKKSLL